MSRVDPAPTAITTTPPPPNGDFLNRVPATLFLSDGTQWPGYSFGSEHASQVTGEVVFQTGMVGYVESLTDPSYFGQMLVLTYPLIGNYGVPGKKDADTVGVEEFDEFGVGKHFERDRIFCTALLVSSYCPTPSHWASTGTLSQWLKLHKIVALEGIDTRALTKHIRSFGAVLGRIVIGAKECRAVLERPVGKGEDGEVIEDPNTTNLVAQVSTKQNRTTYNAHGTPRVVAVDCGMKSNQIRELVGRGCCVVVVPWDADLWELMQTHDALFLSNGPGDPSMCEKTIQNIKKVLTMEPPKPIFGICLGNQLLALSAGARTYKLPFGNRGHNIPCINLANNKCYITTQNHGFAVDTDTLPSEWGPLFINANDFTNEGICHRTKPFFSVQFHPEAKAGPDDTMFLFDTFIESVKTGKTFTPPEVNGVPPHLRLGAKINHGLSKVVVIGSGGLSIGQAGEFDYSGSQALKALKEEGIYTVLINPNIATVQTSKGLASKVYFVPITPEFVTKVLEQERPDGILLNFGGQTALNCGVALHNSGILQKLGVKVLGTPVQTIINTEDRQLFAAELEKIREPIAKSFSAANVEEAVVAAREIGYPVIARAAFALGGLGSGFANNEKELVALCQKAFAVSPQVLVERSMKGWKEIEYEVVRDCFDNCITVCNMENFDPLGVHTGDSIVVAPSQTLSDDEYQMLRTCAIKVVRHLGVIGECNIQYALNPHSLEYCIIEVNARLSRSSALASKATGYPLAFVAAKLSIGMPLPSIPNSVTKHTTAFSEPSLDYIVLKMPRWDLSKFGPRVSKHISSAMKSVGEVMAIGRTFEEVLQKAIRMVTDYSAIGFESRGNQPNDQELANPTDQRIYFLAAAFENGATVDHVHSLTHIDKWFLTKLKGMVELKATMRNYSVKNLPAELLLHAKKLGFSDRQIANCVDSTQFNVRAYRESCQIFPVSRQIDTVAAEFPAMTNYLYMTYTGNTLNDVTPQEGSVIVLGSGAYRIGSSVEFDWCAVGCIRTLGKLGYKSIMINCNPETVSTDYDECQRLYFDEESLERVLDVYQQEKAFGVVVSVGGQIPNNLAMPLFRANVNVLGTSPEMIDRAENRYKFSRMLDQLKGVDQPQWKEATSLEEACKFCDMVGYPVLVRPSYVLSGAAMNVAYSHSDLQQMLTEASKVSAEYPVVVSKFILGAKEIEVDAVARDGEIVVAVISEHVENAGVHSGDATLVLPAQDLSQETLNTVADSARKIIASLQVTGPVNIQFLAKDNEVKVIECNLRASRSFPFDSKTVDRDFIEIATRVMMGHDAGFQGSEVFASSDSLRRVGVKVSQFSFPRLSGADPVLGVEMASTGEVACFGRTREEAYVKALLSSGFVLPKHVILLSIGSFKDKNDFLESARLLEKMRFRLLGTHGTAEFFQEHGIEILPVNFMLEDENSDTGVGDEELINSMLRSNKIDLIINTPSMVRYRRQTSVGYQIRRMAVDFSVPLIVNIKCAKLLVSALHTCLWDEAQSTTMPSYKNINVGRFDFVSSNEIVMIPGFVDIRSHVIGGSNQQQMDVWRATAAMLAQGVTLAAISPESWKCVDASALKTLVSTVGKNSCIDFLPWFAASNTNFGVADSVAHSCIGLIGTTAIHPQNAVTWQEHLKSWPQTAPICIDANASNATEAVLLCSLMGRAIHLSNVSTAQHILFVKVCKAQGVRLTCDISPHHLFFFRPTTSATTTTTTPAPGTPKISPLSPFIAPHSAANTVNDWQVEEKYHHLLTTQHDQDALWAHLDLVDCFASAVPPFTIANMVPLLLDAVRVQRIALSRLVELLHTNPSLIFDLPKQQNTYIEIDMDERWSELQNLDGVVHNSTPTPTNSSTASTTSRGGYGKVRRVVLRDHLACVDGTVLVAKDFGRHTHRHAARQAGEAAPLGTPKIVQAEPPRLPVFSAFSPILTPLKGETAILEEPLVKETSHPLPTPTPTSATIAAAVTTTPKQTIVPLTLTPPHPTTLLAGASSPGTTQPQPQQAARGSLTTTTTTHIPIRPTQVEVELVTAEPVEATTWFRNRSILSMTQFSKETLRRLLEVAREMQAQTRRRAIPPLLQGRIMACLFFEPSTRTHLSFDSAAQRLGGNVMSLDSQQSMMAKGESFRDTVRMLDSYADVLILRHNTTGSVAAAAKHCAQPVINAGDGEGEHPTQALVDIYTIIEEKGTVNGLTVTISGDLKGNRVAHSLAHALALYDVRLHLVSPPGYEMPKDVLTSLASHRVEFHSHNSLDAVLPYTDVLYITPFKRSSFASDADYETTTSKFRITLDVLHRARENMILMHPLPRFDEVSEDVDGDPRAVYFRQAQYGVYVRMALLALIMGKIK